MSASVPHGMRHYFILEVKLTEVLTDKILHMMLWYVRDRTILDLRRSMSCGYCCNVSRRGIGRVTSAFDHLQYGRMSFRVVMDAQFSRAASETPQAYTPRVLPAQRHIAVVEVISCGRSES